MTSSLAIVADFDSGSKSHAATNDAIAHSAAALGLAIEPRRIGTAELDRPDGLKRLGQFSGIWIGPGSPYESMDGALAAIRMARERQIPLFGTCGGFQHLILEYARNVLGLTEAEHEESAPQASRLLISRLACSLAGRTMTITLDPGSMVARIYGAKTVQEEYLCNFGVNPEYVDALRSGPLRVVGSDAEGAVRAVELPGHPFFVGTLFLPQHSSTPSNPHPLVSAFLKACLRAPSPAIATSFNG
ncbi:MAG: gamma-glutamyl-gamma-aminobutyrate hydrolase family protein [Verrucomicrobiales bacterium]|nr:gamma-glutamyl-gamma-aminobutyrate hydrolase family protein [Verrucomicrobiales bacterium]